TIYLYFKDKTDIFESLCEETFARLRRRLAAIAADNGDPGERVRRAGRSYVEFALENPNHYMVTFVMKGDCRDQHSPRLAESGFACFAAFRDIVGQAIAARKFRFTDVDEVSQLLWGCGNGGGI